MKTLLLTILLCGLWTAVSCQMSYPTFEEFYHSFRAYDNKDADKTLDLKNIKGSPYFNDDFMEGEITNSQGITYMGIQLRYNIYNDQMEFLGSEKKKIQINAPETIKKLKIGKDQFVYSTYFENKTTKKGYFQCLNEGEVLLLKRYEIFFQKPGENKPYNGGEPAKFIKRPNTFYLQKGNTAAIQVTGNKAVKEVLSDKQSEIQTFIKKEKLNIKKDDDLLKVVNYYCSLK